MVAVTVSRAPSPVSGFPTRSGYDGAFVPSYTLAADGNTVGKWELD